MGSSVNLLVETLNMILLPPMISGIPYQNSIKMQLEELEGDYYTFLHSDNISIEHKNGQINSEGIAMIENIRISISAIDSEMWNPTDFINNSVWSDIRKQVILLFMKGFDSKVL
jgi:hypothetical protein